ncbi:MAG: orotate phosphoribosyltransferase [Anaerolineae bacterium]
MKQQHSSIESLALTLFDIGAVRLGQFMLRSGQPSPIYLDLRLLVSFPQALRQATAVYRAILASLTYDVLVATPLAGLPIGTAVALDMDQRLIYPRNQAKDYGTGKMIEGKWDAGETAVILDDVITLGGSIIRTLDTLRHAGIQAQEAVVLIDRQQGGRDSLHTHGCTLHAGFAMNQLMAILEANRRITAAQRAEVCNALNLS